MSNSTRIFYYIWQKNYIRTQITHKIRRIWRPTRVKRWLANLLILLMTDLQPEPILLNESCYEWQLMKHIKLKQVITIRQEISDLPSTETDAKWQSVPWRLATVTTYFPLSSVVMFSISRQEIPEEHVIVVRESLDISRP